MTRKSSRFDFEQSLEKLESLVEAMEEGDLSLEQSLKAFEEGIKLTRECQVALTQAEQKVQKLIQGSEPPAAEDFDAGIALADEQD